MASSEEEHHLSNPILLSVPSPALHPLQEEGTQLEGGSGFHPTLKPLQDVNQARAQLECELAQETQGLAQRYDDRQIKLARRHERWQAEIVKQADATFQEVSPMQAWLTLSSYCLGECPLQFPPLHEWSAGHCHTTG